MPPQQGKRSEQGRCGCTGVPLTPDRTAAGGVEQRPAGREIDSMLHGDAALLSIKVTASIQAVSRMIAEPQNGCTGRGLEGPAELVRLRTVNK